MFILAYLMQYLLNKCMDSDQTYTETLLGGDLELIRFWTQSNFQGHQPIKNVEFNFSDAVSSE